MIRTTSMQCIQAFVQSITPALLESNSPQGQFYYSLMLLTIKSCKFILKTTNNDNIRRPIISLMRLIAIQFKSLKKMNLNYDILPLINEDNEEEDILLNLIHIQIRTRVKGLRQLMAMAKEVQEGTQSRLAPTCIRQLLFPLIFAYIAEYTKVNDSFIREECALAIGALSGMLNWGHYMSLFRKVYNMVRSFLTLID